MAMAVGKAAVFVGIQQPLEIRTYPILAPRPGEVRLSLVSSGICGTDIHILNGRIPVPAPLILGHEFVGRVEAWGGRRPPRDGLGRALKKGDLAVACVAIPCGRCFNCRRGETASCLNFGVTYVKDPSQPPHFYGGYAEILYSPAANLVRVPRKVDARAAAAFPCAGPTIIRACHYGGGLEEGEIVVVQGTGPVGLFAIAWAAVAGCTVVAIGSGQSPFRLRMARAFGAQLVLDYRTTTIEDRLSAVRALAKRRRRGDGADVVIEASGSPAAVPEGLELLRTRGRYLIPGQYSSSGPVTLHPEKITFRALRLIGSGQYTLTDLDHYLNFLARNPRLQTLFAKCLSAAFPVTEANAAVAAAEAGREGKVVLIPTTESCS